jgi:sulfite reductase beta subunit-like hemoprotein
VTGAALDEPRRRRDRCPGVLQVHEAADGAVARVRLPGGRVSAAQLAALADAVACGSGVLDLTARANVQVRGLREDVVGVLAAAGLVPSATHERIRNIVAGPLGGRGPGAVVETDALVAALDRALCADPELAALPGRFLFAIDDGSGLVAGCDADVLLAPAGGAMALIVGGVDTGLRSTDGVDLALAAARAFLVVRGSAWRVRELPRFATAGRRPALRSLSPGTLVQRDGRVAVTALAPLGRLDEVQLRGLARLGADTRVSPWRTITLVDLPDAGVADDLARLGLVLDPASGWHGLSACVGVGACARARVDVRAAAAARAMARDPGAPREHWSACERRCGEPPDVGLAMYPGGAAL